MGKSNRSFALFNPAKVVVNFHQIVVSTLKLKISKVSKKMAEKGRTRIRTGVVRIKTESDNHYTIQPNLNFAIFEELFLPLK